MPPYSKLFLTILIVSMILTIVKMLKHRKNHFWISSIIGSILFAFFFTISSLFWTTDIAYDRETLQHLEFGWPIPFDIQNQDRYEPPFPWEMGFGYEMSDYYIKENFYLSLFINFLSTLLIWISVAYYLVRRERFNNQAK